MQQSSMQETKNVRWGGRLPLLCSLSHKFLFPESVQSRKGKEKSPFSLTRLA